MTEVSPAAGLLHSIFSILPELYWCGHERYRWNGLREEQKVLALLATVGTRCALSNTFGMYTKGTERRFFVFCL